MKPIVCHIIIYLLLSSVLMTAKGQVAQVPQVYNNDMGDGGASNLHIRQTASSNGTILINSGFGIGSKIGAVSISTNSLDQYFYNWVQVCLPSTTGNISYGYIACDEFYARIDQTNKYATVTASSLFIRSAAGSGSSPVTINSSSAFYGQNSIVALTGNTSTVGVTTWREVYLTRNCSQSTGWLSGDYLTVNSSTTNYKTVGGRVCDNASSCSYLGNINGATINISGIGSTHSSGGFYEYKLPTNYSCSITCTHPSYNASNPTSYSFTASSNNYTRNFILSNSCSVTLSPTSNTSVTGSGGNFSVSVTASSCSWTASTTYSWITITSGSSGSGNGTVQYSVSSNPNQSTRTGSISIGDKTFSITQAAASSLTSSFTFTSPAYVNSPVSFTDQSTGNPSPNSWLWNFGDGNTSTTRSPSHTFTSTGIYSVSLTVTNSSNNSSTSTQAITVIQPPAPIANFYANRNNITPGTTVNFTDNSLNGPSTWEWTFSGGVPSSSTSQNPSPVQYNTPGTYRVQLKVTNASGSNTKTISGYITVSRNGTNALIPPPANAIKLKGHQYTVAEPIQVGTGSYCYKHSDLIIPVVRGNIDFTRYYNSINSSVDGMLGYGWTFGYQYSIDNQSDTLWNLHYPDGHLETFIPLYGGSGESFSLYAGCTDSLRKNSGGDFTLYSTDNKQYHFNSSGKLDQVTDLNGNATSLAYTNGKLSDIIGAGGRKIAIAYNSFNRISAIGDMAGRVCSFGYDPNGNLVSATDARGNLTAFTYDGSHRMITVTNPSGDAIITNGYDAYGRIILQKDAHGESTNLSYDNPSKGDATITYPDNSMIVVHHDAFYRKTSVKDALGFTERFEYDDNNNETKYTDQDNRVTIKSFDYFGNLVSRSDPGNRNIQTIYNRFNSPLSITDPRGNLTKLSYDAKDNLTSIQLPDNNTRSYAYDALGQRTKETDPKGNSVSFTYSTTGDQVSITAANGTKWISYDAAGRIVSETDENSFFTFYTYDENNNIIGIRDPMGNTMSFKYDANNQMIESTDKNGVVTKFSYDKKGRLISKTDENGNAMVYSYDNMDHLVLMKDANGNSSSYSYDQRGRKISMTNSAGTTKMEYDGLNNVVKITDASNKVYQYSYNESDRVKSVTDGVSNVIGFTYDNDDNLISMTTARGKQTQYQYDAMNRLISVSDANAGNTTATYDQNGNLSNLTDANGHGQKFNYDAINRLTEYIDGDGNSTKYGYDAVGNNTSIQTSAGTISKSYDALNRLTALTVGAETKRFTYDKNSNVISMSNGTGTSQFVYDALNYMTGYTDPFNKTVHFAYDKAGNKIQVTYSNGKSVSYAYDNANRLSSVTDFDGKTFRYSYDAYGRVVKLQYPNGVSNDFDYDNAGRLISAKNLLANGDTICSSVFTLDADWNRINEKRKNSIPSYLLPQSFRYSYSSDNKLVSDSVWNYVNDVLGNRSSKTKGATKENAVFSLDNLLQKFTDTSGNIFNYRYNAIGQRLERSSGASLQRFVLDVSDPVSKVLEITDGNGSISSQYIYGLGLLERVDANGSVLYYHYDAQHNTVALSDASGAVKDSYTYDPFGNELQHVGKTDQPFTFLGEYGVEKESSSVYYVRARYYDAGNGRFLSKDAYPVDVFNGQSVNRYAYALNNPNLFVDFSGNAPNWNTIGQAGSDLANLFYHMGLGVVDAFSAGGQLVLGKYVQAGFSAYSTFQDFNDASRYSTGFFGNLYYGLKGKGTIPEDWYEGFLDNFNNTCVGQYLKVISEANSIISIGRNLGSKKGYELFSNELLDNGAGRYFVFHNVGLSIELNIAKVFQDWVKDPLETERNMDDICKKIKEIINKLK